jgi:hypothetical protein
MYYVCTYPIKSKSTHVKRCISVYQSQKLNIPKIYFYFCMKKFSGRYIASYKTKRILFRFLNLYAPINMGRFQLDRVYTKHLVYYTFETSRQFFILCGNRTRNEVLRNSPIQSSATNWSSIISNYVIRNPKRFLVISGQIGFLIS